MPFNLRTAVKKSDLTLLSSWMALQKEFVPLFAALRAIGNEDLIEKIYYAIYKGDTNSINSIISPQELGKLDKETQLQVNNAISSIVGIMQQVNDQEIFHKIAQLDKMDKKDKDAVIEQLSNSAVEELTNYFSKTLIEQMKNNPGIIPLLRSDRVGLQVGIPEARLTGDVLNKQLKDAYKNDMPFVTNFLNLISTLLYRSIISEKDLNSLMPTLGENIQISPQQDYNFIEMCETGDSQAYQYHLLKWIEETEKIEPSDEIVQENKLPKKKNLEMIKRLADQVKEEEFRANGTDRNTFYKLYDIFNSINEPKNIDKFGELSNLLNKAGLDSSVIANQLFDLGWSFKEILLNNIPAQYHTLLLTARRVSELTSEEQELYKAYYPELGNILEENNTAKQIRTAQLLLIKDATTKSWGKQFNLFYDNIHNIFPQMNKDKFVQFVSLQDDAPIRKDIQKLAKGFDVSVVVASEDEYEISRILQLLNLNKSSDLFKAITKLMNNLNFRNNIMESCGITDLNLFKEIFAQKDILLDVDNLHISPGIVKLWNEPQVMAGREIMERTYTGKITTSDILRSAGFNPFATNGYFENAVLKQYGESIEDYKNRMALMLDGLIEAGNLYQKEGDKDSPLSFALKNNIYPPDSATKAISILINQIIREENIANNIPIEENIEEEAEEEPIDEFGEFEEMSRSEMEYHSIYFPLLKDKIPETKTIALSMAKKSVLEELLSRIGLSEEEVGILNVDPKKNPIQIDPEFQEVGLSTDSDLSRKVIEIFRNYFNLPICSYEIQTNSPDECMTNKNGFKLDFSILADKLIFDGEKLGLKPNIILAGETFGYDSYTGRPLITDKEGQEKRNSETLERYKNGVSSADGKWKIYLSPDGKQLLADYPETNKDGEEEMKTGIVADRFVEYSIRSSYKEPYETFLAHAMGADTLFVPKFNPNKLESVVDITNNIAQQLDELFIIWKSARGESKAYKTMMAHREELSPEFSKYFSGATSPYTSTELYMQTLLAHYDLQNIIIPLYKANPGLFPMEDMKEYQKNYQELCRQMLATSNFMEKAIIQDKIDVLRNSMKYNLVTDNYRAFLNGSPIFGEEYSARILESRNKILALANEQRQLGEIKNIIFDKENPLFKKIAVMNNGNYHTFSPTIYDTPKVANTYRWWRRS